MWDCVNFLMIVIVFFHLHVFSVCTSLDQSEISKTITIIHFETHYICL